MAKLAQNGMLLTKGITLTCFISAQQLRTMQGFCKGEEKQFFIDKLNELHTLINNMPATGKTDGQGGNAICQLRYFHNSGAVWYITERDTSVIQHQAFGWAQMFPGCGELGYISIEEIIQHGAQLDLHFTPIPVKDIPEKNE